jgi:anti-sigma28 factor (negative regulator of flagellin synthesis)
MNDVSPLDGLASSFTLREFTDLASHRRQEGGVALTDRVEISELAALLSRLAELPEDRARKVVDIRNAIQNGTYETDEKLDIVSDRLLEDLTAD